MRFDQLKIPRQVFRIAVIVCFLSIPAPLAAVTLGAPETERRYHELPNFHQVNTRLYRGGQPRSGGVQKLAALGIKTIISLRADDERAAAEQREAEAAGLRYFNIPLERWGRPARASIDRTLALIDDPANGTVFLHCAHGQDRTGLVIAVYRIGREGWTSERALNEAKKYGMKFWQRGMKDYVRDYYRDQPRDPHQ